MSSGDQVEQVEQGIQALDMLSAEAAEIDAEMGPAPGAPADVGQQEAEVDPMGETAGMLTVGFRLIEPLIGRPYFRSIYNEESAASIASVYVPLAQKYGWETGSGILAKYGLELAAVGVALSIGGATVKAEKAYRAEQEAAEGGATDGREDKPAEDDQGQQQSGPAVVSFGSGVVS